MIKFFFSITALIYLSSCGAEKSQKPTKDPKIKDRVYEVYGECKYRLIFGSATVVAVADESPKNPSLMHLSYVFTPTDPEDTKGIELLDQTNGKIGFVVIPILRECVEKLDLKKGSQHSFLLEWAEGKNCSLFKESFKDTGIGACEHFSDKY